MMSIIGWIILGLIAGFIASKIVNKMGQGFLLDAVLGIVGAIVGGFIFDALGGIGITGFNLYSMIVAIIGAIIACCGSTTQYSVARSLERRSSVMGLLDGVLGPPVRKVTWPNRS